MLDAIEKSSGAAKRSATGAQSVDLAGVAPGLPGGTAIEAARMLGDRWGRELLAWTKNMDEYAGQLTAAARRYRAEAHDLRVVPVRWNAAAVGGGSDALNQRCNALHLWWQIHNFRVPGNTPSNEYLWVENNADSFRMAFEANPQGGFS
ncbi:MULTISPECIES: hypothetical protein [Amycolatopsis]|uniref:hypothetical protein n=1 Tax=Amycolatopsis TaxID=1813 RepID=UPI0018E31ABD|nr:MULTISPECIES: hypothetical protein [Amycolatopsis]